MRQLLDKWESFSKELVIVVITLVIYLCHYELLTISGPVTGASYLLAGLAIVLLGMYVYLDVPAFLFQHIKGFEWLFFALSPVLAFFMVELFEENRFQLMETRYFFMNLIWYALTFIVVLWITRRIKYTVIGLFSVMAVVGLVNYYVYSFRGTPIQPWDFRSFKTAVNVASNYSYDFCIFTFWAIILLEFVMFTAVGLQDKKCNLWKNKGGRIFSLTALLLLVTFLGIYINVGIMGLFGERVYAWKQDYQYQRCGFYVSFMENVRVLQVEKPEGYDKEKVSFIIKNALKESGTKAESGEEKTSGLPAGKKPNIIAIMNESFADLSVVRDIDTDKDYMPFIHGLKKNTIRGNLYMSIFGSNTCNSEFEFMTGNTMAFLPGNSIPYQQYIKGKTSSLCSILKAQGYTCEALHPYYPNGWNRPKVYESMGFERYLSMDDFQYPSTLRGYITDQANYDKLIEMYEAHDPSEGPYFMLNVTMQNHGGFSSGTFRHSVSICDKYSKNLAVTEEYLNLVKYSDDAFKKLVAYFKNVDEPTVIVMFGDHQPNLLDSFYEGMDEEKDLAILQDKYITPFIIWANFDIPEETIDKMSANYLSSYLLSVCGLSMPDYNRYLLQLYETIPAMNANGYYDKEEEKWHTYDEKTKYSELLNDYNILEYNNLFDDADKVTDVFELKK